MADQNTPLDSSEDVQNIDTVTGVNQDISPETQTPEVKQDTTPVLDTENVVPEEKQVEQEKAATEEIEKDALTSAHSDDTVNIKGVPFKDFSQDLAKIENNPSLNTLSQAVQKHTIPNRPKAMLLNEAASDPIALMALVSEGAITASDVAAHRNQLALHTAQTNLQNLQKAWIKAPESGNFSAAGNAILHLITGAADLALALPDAAVTHYKVLATEPKTETDTAFQTFLLGSTKLRELEGTLADPTASTQDIENAQAEKDELDALLSEMSGKLREQDDYDETYDKYMAGYYEDQSVNFFSTLRDNIKVGNNEALDSLTNNITDILDTNLDTLGYAKMQLDDGNLLGATGTFLSGVAGLTAESVEALVTSPRALIDLTAYSLGNIAGGGAITKGLSSLAKVSKVGISIPDKFGALVGYQSMFAADAYKAFEQEYGHLPEGQQALILNAVSGLASFIAVAGDDFMVGSLSKMTKSAHSVKNSAFKDVLSGVPVSQAKATAKRLALGAVPTRTLQGAGTESIQEFSESLLTQFAGTQDWDKVSGRDALVEGILASGAGGLTGSVGDVGNALRGMRKGNFVSTLDKSKEGYTPIRNELKDAETFVEVNESMAEDLNSTVETMERDEAGEVLPTQANITKVAALYDSMLSLVGGMDSIIGDIPLFKGTNINDALTKAVQSGGSLNDALVSTMGIVQDALDPNLLMESYKKDPASVQKLMATMQEMPQYADKLGQDFQDYVTVLSQITGQVTGYVNALTNNFDLDAMAANIDTQTSANRKQRAKDKLAKIFLKKKDAAEQEIQDEVAPVRERSKFTTDEVIYQFREDLRETEATDASTSETKETETTEAPTATEVSEAEAVDIAEQHKGEDKEGGVVLESPTTAHPAYVSAFQSQNKAGITLNPTKVSKYKNLGEVNARMRGLLTEINADKDAAGKLAGAYITTMNTLVYQLNGLTRKPNLSEIDRVKAQAIEAAIATYAYSFSKSSKTNNESLGKVAEVLNKLDTKTVSTQFNVRTVVDGYVGKASTSSAPKAAKNKGALNRESASVSQKKRKGTVSTEGLVDLNLHDAFAMLGGLVHGMLEGNISDVSSTMVDDVADVLSSKASEFDVLYTKLKSSVEALQKSHKQIFKTGKTTAQAQQTLANDYLALAEYFKRVDPAHRDLTHVLAMHSPEVHQAVEKVLDTAPIPSEFSAELKTKAKELTFEELPTTRETVPQTTEEKHGMMVEGLNAIHAAGADTVKAYIDFLIEKHEFSPTGDMVTTLQSILGSAEIADFTLPMVMVNTSALVRLNSFINSKQIPNRAKEADTDVEATWASNPYHGVAEALNRLSLATDKLDIFKVATTTHGGMYQVFNIFTVLADPEHENYNKVVASFTPEELAQIGKISPHVQSMRNMYSHMYHKADGLKEFMHNNRALDLFETMSTTGSSAYADNYLHPNISAIIAQTALEYAMTDGISAFGYNDSDAVKDLTNAKLAQDSVVRNALASGSMVNSVASSLGRAIVKRLGISVDGKVASSEDLAQLELSLGHMAIYGLLNEGFIEGYTFATATDSQGTESVVVQDNLDAVKVTNGLTLNTSMTRRMLRFSDDKVPSERTEGDTPSVFEELGLSKSLVKKLYGETAKNDIATTPEDITIEKGNAGMHAVVKGIASKTPLYMHAGKVEMFNNLSEEAQLLILKGGVSTEGKHANRLKVIEAKNRKAKATLARIRNTVKEIGNDGMYFLHQIIGSNMRYTGNNPRGIDPVNMSEARFLTNVTKDDIITFNSTDAKQQAIASMFQKAVLQNLDNKAEEMTAATANTAFNRLLTLGTLQRAITLVTKAKTEKLSDAESAELVALLDGSAEGVEFKTESVAHGLDAVHALANYQAAYTETGTFSFDGHIGVEIDGKNNGSAHAFRENAPIAAIADALRMAKSVGLNFDDETNLSFADIKAATEAFLDAYQHLAKAAGEAGDRLSSGEMTEEYVRELLGRDSELAISNRGQVYGTVLNLLSPQSGNTKSVRILEEKDGEIIVSGMGRQLFKDVLMTVLYGAGMETQDAYFANRIAETHLDTLEYFASIELTEENRAEVYTQVTEYFATLTSVGIYQKMPMPDFNSKTWQQALLTEEYAFHAGTVNYLTEVVANTIGLTYRDALNTPTYKTIIEQAGSIAESANINHMHVSLVVRKLRAKYIAQEGLPAEAKLTDNQERHFWSSMVTPILTKVQAPISATDAVEGSIDGVGITQTAHKREEIPSHILEAAQTQYDAELAKDSNFKGTREQFLPEKYRGQWVQDFVVQGNTSTLKSQVSKRLLESPELSTAPSLTHSKDSGVQANIAMTHDTPFINVFDAQLGVTSTITALANAGNTAFNTIAKSFNAYEALTDAFEASDKAIAEALTKDEIEAVNTELANALGLPDFQYAEYMQSIRTAYKTIAKRAARVEEVLISTDQFPMTEASPVRNADHNPEASLEAIREEFAESLAEGGIPTVVDGLSVKDSRDFVKNAATALTTESELIIDDIAQDISRYSVGHSEVGRQYTATMEALTSNLENLANVSTKSADATALKNAAKAIKKLMYTNRNKGMYALPTVNINTLFADIEQMLQESTLEDSVKKLLASERGKLLLRTTDAMLNEDTNYTQNVIANLWLNMGDNKKWVNAPLSKLISVDFIDALTMDTPLGMSVVPVHVLHALLMSPKSKAFIGNDKQGDKNKYFSEMVMSNLAKMTGHQLTAFYRQSKLFEKTGNWKRLNRAPMFNNMLMDTLLKMHANPAIRFQMTIPAKASLFENTGEGKATMQHIQKRIVRWYDKQGVFGTGTATKAAANAWVLNTLLSPVEQERLMGTASPTTSSTAPIASEVANASAPKAISLEVDYTLEGDNVQYNLDISGKKVVLEGENLQISAQGNQSIIQGKVTKVVSIDNELEFVAHESETGGYIYPKLGTPTYNSTTNDTTYTEVSHESLVSTYDDIVATSATTDSATHASHLRNLISTMSAGLGKVKVLLGETVSSDSSGYFMNNTVTVTINKLLSRNVTNFMSGGEVMAHELVHAVTDNLGSISPNLAIRAQELHTQAKATLTWQDLIDPTLHPDDAEDVAKKLYDYMFEGNTHEELYISETTGLTSKHTVSGRPQEFMALMATNETVARAGNKVMARKAQNRGFTAKVIALLNAAFGLFFKRVNTQAEKGQTISEEMLNIVYQAAKLQNNHRSVLGHAVDASSTLVDGALNTSDSKIREFIKASAAWAVKQPVLGTGNWTNPKSYAAALASPALFVLGYDVFKERFREQMRRIKFFQKQTVLDIVNELGETTTSMHRIYDLISRRSKAIDQARMHTEARVSDYIQNQMFKTPMSDRVAASLTHAVLETDLVTLVDTFGTDKVLDILQSDEKRLNSLRKTYQNKLKQYKNAHYYINHAKALGESMARGNTIFYGVHSNAHSIARLAGDTDFGSVETESVHDIESYVDVLASLYAVKNTPISARVQARNFLIKDNDYRKQNNIDTVDTKHVGFTALLSMHRDVKAEALELNFNNNPMLMRKGYIREQYNPNVELMVVGEEQVEAFEKQGYEVVTPISQGVDTEHKDRVLMANRYAAKSSYDQGAFSHTGFKAMGERTPENLMPDGDYEQDIVLTDNGDISMTKARKSMFMPTPITRAKTGSASIAPTRNDDGTIVGYRYTMTHEVKRKALDREERIHNVLARTLSSVEDKASSQEHNMVVLEEVFHIYDTEYGKNPDAFMLVEPVEEGVEPTPESEMWAMLPSYTREAIVAKNLERGEIDDPVKLYVPKRMATLLFGSAPLTVASMNKSKNIVVRYAGAALSRFMEKKYGKMFASIYKQALNTSKDSMVIKNVTTTIGNIVSNHYALSVAGIPQKHIIKKSVQGYKEIIQYQDLMHHIGKVQQELAYTSMSESRAKVLRSQLADLEGRVSSLSILPLIDEGLYQTIVEDIDTSANETSFSTPLEELGDALLAKTGVAETVLREAVFVTHDSRTYRYLRDAAQVSDFVSRYVMYSHMVEEQGMSTKDAVHEARDTFIMYDAPMSKPLKALNDLGFFNFAKFLLRTQRVLAKNIRQNPTRTLMYSILWAGMAAPATMDVLMTPFNFGEILMKRAQINPFGFISNGLTELPIIKLLT